MASGNACIGKPALEFQAPPVVDGAFTKVKLSEYKGKYRACFFSHLQFTFVCPTEIIAFSNMLRMLSISADSQFTHLAWINTPQKERDIRLLAHVTRILSRDYGPKEDEGIAYRGLFIIDGKGDPQITCSDLSDGYSVDEALRLAQALQFTGEHEEVCPAGWVPGSHTVKPNSAQDLSCRNSEN
ncbi:hypothetical protein K5549_002120 [Capra hircus]|nr:hypothetical protein K5549_002120 [Capra hircus]